MDFYLIIIGGCIELLFLVYNLFLSYTNREDIEAPLVLPGKVIFFVNNR